MHIRSGFTLRGKENTLLVKDVQLLLTNC